MCWRGHSFLCLRRGVSHCFDAAAYAAGFSLPTQRCFLTQPLVEAQKTLFSAYAEVFPIGARSDPARKTFLCLRRGVSRPGAFPSGRIGFSLPTQRCFHQCRKEVAGIDLFSAYAEVFPDTLQSGFSALTFLCLRRGVSDLDDFVRQLVVLFSAYAEVFLPSQ